MERVKFIEYIEIIMHEEGWQCKKERVIKSSVNNQRKAVNTIAKELGINKLSYEEVEALGFG